MEHCLNIRELADLEGLPAGDPRRRHVDACPRCQGLAEAHALFLDPGDTTDLDGLAAADAALQRRLDAALAASPAAAARPVGRRGPWLALAAVLAVCALGVTTSELLRLRDGARPRVGEHLRGDGAAGLTVTVAGDRLQGDWSDAPVAGTYVVVFFGADLSEVGRSTTAGSSFEMALADLPPHAVFCQALAVSHGDTLARSGIIAVPPARE